MSNIVKFTDDDDRDLGALLSRELTREASSVRPSDRYAEVLAATQMPTRRPAGLQLVGIAAAVLLLVGVGLPFVWHRVNAATPPLVAASTLPSVPSTTTGPSLPLMQVGLPVYYIDPKTNLFYEERPNLPTQVDALVTAVNAVLNVVPTNAQLVTFWKGGTVNAAQVVDGKVVVDLSAASYSHFKNADQARLAAFQLYYTVNKVLSDGQTPLPLALKADGKSSVPLLGDTSAAGAWNNPPALGSAWIEYPQVAQRIAAGAATLSGYVAAGAPAPQVTIVKASNNAPVAGGTATLGVTNGSWQAWSYAATLPAGEYLATVSTDSTAFTAVFTAAT